MATPVTEPPDQEERTNRWDLEPPAPIGLSPTRIFLFLFKVGLVYGVASWAWSCAQRSGLAEMIHQPVVAYLRSNGAGLPMTASGLVDWWVGLGAGAFLVSALLRSFPARFLWCCWGVWSIVMVSAGTPKDARAVVVGVATLSWVAVSVVALRGRG
ncbi:hypothetical protein ACFVV7_33910 [Streptomyces globisporus]|uniref:hypothetical protein n=1 Tax=Streptomyces globisporus TaxID=1908 RepID=UPI0036D814DB